jgi:hypothetical protein
MLSLRIIGGNLINWSVQIKDIIYHSGVSWIKKLAILVIANALLIYFISFSVKADGLLSPQYHITKVGSTSQRPHVPIGVFIAEMPAPNSLVVAVAPNYAEQSGMLLGSKGISPQSVVSTTPWFFNPRYFDRVTPESTNTFSQNGTIHYGITNDLSLAVTAIYVHRYMSSLTFKGPDGIIPLGRSYTETMGFSDLTSTVVLRLFEDPIHKVTLNIGAGFPVGSATVNKNILRSNGLFEDSRANYGQQPSSQTYSFLPGLLYSGFLGPLSWGIAYRGRLYLHDNQEGWRPGNSNQFNGWLAYNITPEFEPTLRIVSNSWGRVRGLDKEMRSMTPGADAKFNGGQELDVLAGSIIEGKLIGIDKLDIATEFGLPIYQILNGPQLKKNWQGALQLRYRY